MLHLFTATPSPFNPFCVFPFFCSPNNDTSANISTTFNSSASAAENFTASAIADPTFDGFPSDDSDLGATVTEVVTVGGDDGEGIIETVIIEETEYITVPEETQTVTVAIETVTVGADADPSADSQ